MIVKVIKIPVRYKGVTHPSGQVFDMEDDHFDEKIVKKATAEEEENMVKYSKAADRSGSVKKPEDNIDYSTFSEAELKKVKNDDLKAFLDAKGVGYAADAEKKDYIKAILEE